MMTPYRFNSPSSLLSVVAVPLIAMSICPLGKKEKTEADVCAHFMELGKAAGETIKPGAQKECTEKFEKELASCADRKAAIDCYLSSSGPKDADQCRAKCVDETKSSGASSGNVACINACMSKHGPLMDTNKTKECAQKHSGYGQEAERKACMRSATNSATDSCMRGCRNQ